MVYGANVAICSEINTKHTNTGRQKVTFLTDKPVALHNQ
jgi:hypothetical protein